MTQERTEWSHDTDDVLAEHRQVGMVVHRPAEADSHEPWCHAVGVFSVFGAWVVYMEAGHPCRKCWPKGMPR